MPNPALIGPLGTAPVHAAFPVQRRLDVINGAQFPFQRTRRRTTTGSLILDQQHARFLHATREATPEPMRVWTNGHFRQL
jgi:hypothetical protein